MVCKSKLLVVLAFLLGAGHVLAGIVPVPKVFHAGSEQTSDRLIYVGGSEDGGLLAIGSGCGPAERRPEKQQVSSPETLTGKRAGRAFAQQ